MTTLFEALDGEAQKDLLRDTIVECVAVVVRAVPDPDLPDDRLTMKIVSEVFDTFAPGIPWIDAELARLREICEDAAGDITVPVQDALLVALNRRRKEQDGLVAGKIGGHPAAWASDPQFMAFPGPILRNARATVPVWWMAWTAGMEDDGMMCVDYEDIWSYSGMDPVFAEDGTGETRKNILKRMQQVNGVVGRMVERLMREGT